MSQRQFLESGLRQRVSETVRQIEAETSVEVVVSVQKEAARYMVAWFRAGLVCAALAFSIMMLSPTYYVTWVIPLDSVLGGALGALVCANWPPLKRALTRAAERLRTTHVAADAAFQRLGIAKTRDRGGLLVFVSLFERQVVLRPDTGISVELLGPGYEQVREALLKAATDLDADAFINALGSLTRPLAEAYPRRPDDINELSDEMA